MNQFDHRSIQSYMILRLQTEHAYIEEKLSKTSFEKQLLQIDKMILSLMGE